ncbi:MAG: hypothetical protein WCO48_00380 [Candidatus Taylorbacteria bacterium]
MNKDIHTPLKGVCVVRQGRHKRTFYWDPKLRLWVSARNEKVNLRRVGPSAWTVFAPTIGGGKTSVLGLSPMKAAFSLAAVHAI